MSETVKEQPGARNLVGPADCLDISEKLPEPIPDSSETVTYAFVGKGTNSLSVSRVFLCPSCYEVGDRSMMNRRADELRTLACGSCGLELKPL